MSEEPRSNPWRIDHNKAIGILTKDEPTAIAKASQNYLGTIAGVLLLAIGIAGFVWVAGQAFNQWTAERETTAQTELTRIQNCINN